jgi:hypothetical protein
MGWGRVRAPRRMGLHLQAAFPPGPAAAAAARARLPGERARARAAPPTPQTARLGRVGAGVLVAALHIRQRDGAAPVGRQAGGRVIHLGGGGGGGGARREQGAAGGRGAWAAALMNRGREPPPKNHPGPPSPSA